MLDARRREIVVIFGCGNGLARDAPEASKVDGRLRAGGPQGLRAKPGGDTRPRANHRPWVDDGRDPAKVRCMQPLEGVDLEGRAVACRAPFLEWLLPLLVQVLVAGPLSSSPSHFTEHDIYDQELDRPMRVKG